MFKGKVDQIKFGVGGVNLMVLLLSFQLVLFGTGCKLLLQLFLGLKWCGSRRKFLVVPLLHGCLCWLDYQQEINYCFGVYKCRILVFFVLMVLNPTTICSLTVRSRFRYRTSSVGVLSHHLLLISKQQCLCPHSFKILIPLRLK